MEADIAAMRETLEVLAANFGELRHRFYWVSGFVVMAVGFALGVLVMKWSGVYHAFWRADRFGGP